MSQRSGVLVRQKFKQYLRPALLTSLAFSTGDLLETVMVGHFLKDSALAAVALAEPMLLGIETLYLLFSVGGVTCATVALGKLEKRKANLIFSATLLGGIAAMGLLWLLMVFFLEPLMLSLSGGAADLAAMASGYLRPLLWMGPVMFFCCSVADFINADGQPRYTATILISANTIRLVLGYILMRHTDLGLQGASIAAFIGYGLCTLLVIPYLCQKQRSFHFVIPKLRDFKHLLHVLASGLSVGWMGLCNLISSTVVISLIVVNMGQTHLSILMVCVNITAIADILIDGVTDTLLPITGLLYGEQDQFGIRQILRFARNLLLTAALALMILFLLLPQYAALLFGIDSPQIREQLIPAVRLFVMYLPFYAMSTLLQYYYNTVEQGGLASLLAVLKSLVFPVFFAVLLIHAVPGLFWLCFLCAEASALLVVFLISRNVQKKKHLSDLYLLPQYKKNVQRFDITIKAQAAQAVSLSQQILEFGQKTSVSSQLINLIALAAEEMTLSTSRYAHGAYSVGLIDVSLRVTDRRVYLRFRDNGTPFNPVEYVPPDEDICLSDSLSLLRKLPSHIQHTRLLGFNTTHLTFDR